MLTSSAYALPRVLIVDGRNNHDWRATTDALRATLDSTGLFEVEVTTAPQERWPSIREPKTGDAEFPAAKARFDALKKSLSPMLEAEWAAWNPDFTNYAAVVLNYNGPSWPGAMQTNFVSYVRNGGGVFLVHAANNGFANWPEFNDIIGLGYRAAGNGTCMKVDPVSGAMEPCGESKGSGHGSKHPFVVTTRAPQHPVMRGLPAEWLHGQDELYHHMKGPAKNVTLLASSFSDEQQRGSGQHEAMVWETSFGKGRALVTSMGHFWKGQTDYDSLYCAGFQTIVARSVEYLATGKVAVDVPTNFPVKDKVSIVEPHAMRWSSGAMAASVSEPVWKAKKAANFAAALSPDEEKQTFVLPDGYVAELVACEPMVQEPALAVWDGDGAMYVAEMRSYMQDEAGTGTKSLKNGRIKKLVDTDGDGRMDKATVFAEGLNLPRMILTLEGGSIAAVETDNTSVWKFRDADGDGVSDERTLLWQGSAGSPNSSVEHQESGLDWNLDNWIYISYAKNRYRFTDGTWRAEPFAPLWSQWGVTHDDEGRVFFSDNSTPASGFQIPRQYWNIIEKARKAKKPSGPDPVSTGLPWDMDFLWARNLCATDDRGGPANARKQLTSICGQSVFRGTALPPDARGDYFFCDPTIHVVRRADITNRNGRVFFTNPHGTNEFLNSPDILFRPVHTASGPDGCLTVVDMYRGIIQDAPWLSEGPRKFIKESGLAAQNNRGRIWRIRHRDHTPVAAPGMNGETTAELLRHLDNPNGWWRDMAQRLILLRADRESVAPLLAGMVRYMEYPVARLHALWTLEGMNKADPAMLRLAWRDNDPRVRAAAFRIAEPLFGKNDGALLDAVAEVAAAEKNAEVAKQLILSLGWSSDARAFAVTDQLVEKFLTHEGVFMAGALALWKTNTPVIAKIRSGEAFAKIRDADEHSAVAARWAQGLAQWERELKLPKDMPAEHAKFIKAGEEAYFQYCVSCHDVDGKGTPVPGTGMTIGAPLAGSARVRGPVNNLVPALINGLAGPIEGKMYAGAVMVPAASLGVTRDDRLAEILSYIRYAWSNNAPVVTKDEVYALRKKYQARPGPWTDDELKALGSETKK